MSFDATLLERLAAAFQSTAACGRERVEVGPFRAWFHPESRDPLMSVAVPVGSSTDWSRDLDGLREAFNARRRAPRLEFFAELHPELARALDRDGIRREMAAPVMVLTPERFHGAVGRMPGRYVGLAPHDVVRVRAFLGMQCRAFGMDPARGAAWEPQFRAGLAEGTVRSAAIEDRGRIVSGATIQIGDGAGELAGVGTLPALQGRGYASAVCSRLLENWFAEGHDLCWLSAGEGALGLYARLGFQVVGTQLNYGSSHPA